MQPITNVQTLFRYQRAIRTFTAEEVPDELVHQVLTAAIHGPSGSNTQPWHFIVVRDPTVKRAISEVYEEARAAGPTPSASGARQPLAAAPVLIVACVDTPPPGMPASRRAPPSTPACRISCWRPEPSGSGAASQRCTAVGRRASLRSSASPTRSRPRRSSRSAGPTGTMARTSGPRWPSL
jgi:nitroreductase